MCNVVNINPPAVKYKPQGSGLAIVRGGEVQTVITRDELPDLVLAAAKVLKG
jgi:hypothetical protein